MYVVFLILTTRFNLGKVKNRFFFVFKSCIFFKIDTPDYSRIQLVLFGIIDQRTAGTFESLLTSPVCKITLKGLFLNKQLVFRLQPTGCASASEINCVKSISGTTRNCICGDKFNRRLQQKNLSDGIIVNFTIIVICKCTYYCFFFCWLKKFPKHYVRNILHYTRKQ